jgi:hypothetical protein
MTAHNADQSNLAAQPRRDDFTTEKFVSSRIMRAEGATMKRKNDLADRLETRPDRHRREIVGFAHV